MSLEPYGQEFTNELRFLMANARVSLRSIADGTFAEKAKPEPDQDVIMTFPPHDLSDAEVAERVLSNTFCDMVRELINLINLRYILDDLPRRTEIPGLKRATEDALKAVIADEVYVLATNPAMTVPRKLDAIFGISSTTREAVLGYNDVRNSIEHHTGIAKKDITFLTLAVVTLVDGKPVELPVEVQGGAEVSWGFQEDKITFQKGERIVLSERHLEQAYYALVRPIGNDLLNQISPTMS